MPSKTTRQFRCISALDFDVQALNCTPVLKTSMAESSQLAQISNGYLPSAEDTPPQTC
ncbi:MAG: hypothetical protein KGZ88_12160 [Methylomicrobium sp.]|nr:hypothetical protein [Methylomicrobium sp.]